MTVMYIDSKGENTITSEKVLNNWKIYCFTRDRLSKMKWITATNKHSMQKTTDNSNCGVFLSYFFKQLLNQNVQLLNSPFDIENFRLEITKLSNSYSEIRIAVELSTKITISTLSEVNYQIFIFKTTSKVSFLIFFISFKLVLTSLILLGI